MTKVLHLNNKVTGVPFFVFSDVHVFPSVFKFQQVFCFFHINLDERNSDFVQDGIFTFLGEINEGVS